MMRREFPPFAFKKTPDRGHADRKAREQETNAELIRKDLQRTSLTLSTEPFNPKNGSAVEQFEKLVDAKKRADSKLSTADAMLLAAQENPELAQRRTIELSVPLVNGV